MMWRSSTAISVGACMASLAPGDPAEDRPIGGGWGIGARAMCAWYLLQNLQLADWLVVLTMSIDQQFSEGLGLPTTDLTRSHCFYVYACGCVIT